MNYRVEVPDYFVSPVPGLWTIEQTGEAIEWKDFQCTAVMLPHLQILLRALADQLKGLPSLTATLFVVDALSKGWMTELAQERLSRVVHSAGNASVSARMFEQIVQWLVSLQRMDAEFRHGARAHEAFLCELFEQVPREWLTSQRETSQSLEWLENILGDRSSLLSTRLIAEGHAADRAITTLDFASMQSMDADSIRLRMRTGLDTLPPAESLDVLERFPLAALAKQLASSSDDLGDVARLAQSVSAMLSLPRLPSDPDVLPVGGVSDITNRGQPDRLLMSELALDSDLLIARIANGQALYLRREQPPQPEPKHRCLIIECGVRMWGTMRLYSAAFALGMCIAQERRGGEKVDVVSVAGDSAWLEDLTSRQGIVRFYERLHPDVHPADALADLVQRKSLDLDLDTQPILVLSEATDRDANFRRLTGDFPKPHLLARIEQAGWVELLQRGSLGDTSLQRIRLNEVSPSSEPKRTNHESLPLFLKQTPSPLRFCVHPSGGCVQTFDNKSQAACWVLTHDRRAMLLEDRKLGAIEVGYVPSGRVMACHTPDPMKWLLVIETAPHKTRVPTQLLVDIDARRGVSVCEIKRGNESATEVTYCFDRGQLIRVGNYVTFLDSRSGAAVASSQCEGLHLGGAFFGDTHDIHLASHEGDTVRWRRIGNVPSRPGVAARLEHGMPVVYAHDLSYMVRLDGSVGNIKTTAMQIHTLHKHSIVRVNADATEMLVALRGVTSAKDARLIGNNYEDKLVRLSLSEPKITFAGKCTPAVVTKFEISKHKHSYQMYNVRTHFSGLSFEDDTLIMHAQRKRIAIRVHDVAGVLGFTCQIIHKFASDPKLYPCEKQIPRVVDQYSRWKLRPIKLPSGQAWLDSRGLLHLRAADGSELSLTLSQGLLAGWHSTGTTFGPQYFTAHQASDTNATPEVIHWYTNFVRQQREVS